MTKHIPASVPPEPPTLSASDTAQMVRMLGLERDEMRNGWWLPAEPGPVFCTSIPHAVAEWQRLFENDHERAVAALRAELARWDECRRAVAESIGANPDTWPDHGNAPLAVASVVALRELQADSRAARSTGERTP